MAERDPRRPDTILEYFFGEENRSINVHLFGDETVKSDTAQPEDETIEINGKKCEIDCSRLFFDGSDFHLYFDESKNNPRTGNLQPVQWERYGGEISGQDIFNIYHDKSTLEGVMSMLGVEGAGSLNTKQWALIGGVAVLLVIAFIFLRPYLPMM